LVLAVVVLDAGAVGLPVSRGVAGTFSGRERGRKKTKKKKACVSVWVSRLSRMQGW
jgi:hypothetical protein